MIEKELETLKESNESLRAQVDELNRQVRELTELVHQGTTPRRDARQQLLTLARAKRNSSRCCGHCGLTLAECLCEYPV